MIRRTFWGEVGFFGKLFFHHFRSLSKKFSEFWQEVFGRVVTTAFYMYIGTFWGVFLSFQNIPDFFVIFGICASNLWIFRGKIFLALSKLHSTLLKNHLWRKKNCWKNCNFNTFVVREIFSYFWGQSYTRLAKISLCILDERFGEKQLCWESAQNFHHFRNSSKTLSDFWQEFSGRVVTTALCVPRWSFFQFLKEKNEGKNYFFLIISHCYHFQTLSEKDL